MDLLRLLHMVWSHLTGAFGTIFLVTGIFGCLLTLWEAHRLSHGGKEKEKGKDSRTRRICILTGASSGLGMEYARLLDKEAMSFSINEIWLIARHEDRLLSLQKTLKTPALVLPLDLTKEASFDRIRAALDEALCGGKGEVSLLLNCAGGGKEGLPEAMDPTREGALIDLNVKAPLFLIHACLPYMGPGGRILNVASTAAFQPVPLLNSYSAGKAFLYSYSRALRVELFGKGISVTTVCPYWIYDTRFIPEATGEKRRPFFSSKAADVAKRSLKAALHRNAVSTPTLFPTLHRFFTGLFHWEILSWLPWLAGGGRKTKEKEQGLKEE